MYNILVCVYIHERMCRYTFVHVLVHTVVLTTGQPWVSFVRCLYLSWDFFLLLLCFVLFVLEIKSILAKNLPTRIDYLLSKSQKMCMFLPSWRWDYRIYLHFCFFLYCILNGFNEVQLLKEQMIANTPSLDGSAYQRRRNQPSR